MSRILSYITSSVWAMRQQEFDVMTLVAVRKLDALDKIAADIETKSIPEAMTAKRGERLMNTRYVEVREGNIALIDVNGRLAKRMGFFAEVCEGGTSTENLLKDFQTCLDNPNISAIVLNIDSPGGEAFGINELSQHILNAKGKKPIKAYVSGLGCSGAYWIASACEEIIVDKSAFLGSIGVVSVWIDDTEAYKMLGFDKKVVVSTNAPKKRLDLNKAEDMAEFKAELDAMEKTFHQFVMKGRNKTREQVINDFNQGGVLCGADAVKAGMADRVGSLEGVIKELAKKSKNQASFGAEKGEMIDMSWKNTFKEMGAKLGFRVEETEEIEIAASSESSPKVETSAVDTNAELAQVKAELEAEKQQRLQAEASAFVSAEISAGRLSPAEKDAFLANYLQAAADDKSSPLATGSRVENLKAVQSKRPASGLTEEVLQPGKQIKVLTNEQDKYASMDAEIEAQTSEYVATVEPKVAKKS